MQAFFLISGFLASMVLERYGAARFLRKRVQRLVPPWVGAMALVCAPAVWFLTGGIAPEALPHVGQPFFTTRPEGTGLGVATARRFVEQHGGTLEIRSEPQTGTTVHLWLPLTPVGVMA